MNPALGLAAARVVVGGGAIAAPELGAKLFRLDATANPQLPYMTRLFGSRELVLGLATLASSGSTRRNLVLAGIAVDATDAVAAILSGRDGGIDKLSTAALALSALAAVGAGVAGLPG